MDTMIQSYMEETEDLLQKAEECIIRLEMEYSYADVNELFRIAHTIKGSSHMVGFGHVGNLMHKIEDMLDCARNGSILFDQSIVSLCFQGLDAVKKMLQYKNEEGSPEMKESLVNDASRIHEMIEIFIRVNKKEEEKAVAEEPETGIVSSCLSKKYKGKNKYYITFFIEEDTPMVSPVLITILNSLEEIGTLVYSSVDDNYFSGNLCDSEIKTYDIIISTDIEERELYTYFALFYIEKINIVDLSRSKVKENDYSFFDADDTLYVIILKAFMKLYQIVLGLSKGNIIDSEEIDSMKSLYGQSVNAFDKMKNKEMINKGIEDFAKLYDQIIQINDHRSEINVELCTNIHAEMKNLLGRAYYHTKGKHLFSIFKSEKNGFITRLRTFIEMLNKSFTIILLIDFSNLAILQETEVKELIEIKKEIESQDIEIAIISEGPNAGKIINIFDSIKQVEEFHVYRSQMDAIIGIFDAVDSFQRIANRVKDVQYAE